MIYRYQLVELAGELLHSGGRNKEKGYNGWVTGFSVRSSVEYWLRSVLFVLRKIRSVRQKKKIELALEKYPYWGGDS